MAPKVLLWSGLKQNIKFDYSDYRHKKVVIAIGYLQWDRAHVNKI